MGKLDPEDSLTSENVCLKSVKQLTCFLLYAYLALGVLLKFNPREFLMKTFLCVFCIEYCPFWKKMCAFLFPFGQTGLPGRHASSQCPRFPWCPSGFRRPTHHPAKGAQEGKDRKGLLYRRPSTVDGYSPVLQGSGSQNAEM